MKKYNTFEEFLDTSGIKETVTYETFIDGTNEYEVHNLLYYAYNELTENNNRKHSLKQLFNKLFNKN